MDLSYKTPAELQEVLGQRLRALRLDRELTQFDVAEKAGTSLRTIQKLERGEGSTVETLVRFLKAVGGADAFDAIGPEPTVSPIAILKAENQRRQRVRKHK
jgi:transcriptional regulator with XRE-family HTH domain